MLGIVIGTICLILLIKVVRGRYGWHHGYHHGGYRYGRWGGYFLRRLFMRLNTGPGQEKVVLGELEGLKETLRGLRTELKATRRDIAAIVREPVFDRTKLDALFRTQDALLERARSAAAASFEKVHGALDEKQKIDLADLLEGGFSLRYGC